MPSQTSVVNNGWVPPEAFSLPFNFRHPCESLKGEQLYGKVGGLGWVYLGIYTGYTRNTFVYNSIVLAPPFLVVIYTYAI
jgi:hypothetical protein